MTEICVICHEDLDLDGNISKTKCKHSFHTSCLLRVDNHNCPMCRDTMVNDEQAPVAIEAPAIAEEESDDDNDTDDEPDNIYEDEYLTKIIVYYSDDTRSIFNLGDTEHFEYKNKQCKHNFCQSEHDRECCCQCMPGVRKPNYCLGCKCIKLMDDDGDDVYSEYIKYEVKKSTNVRKYYIQVLYD